MPADESGADDGAIFDVWDRFTLDEVVTVFQRLEALYRAVRRLRGNPPPPALVAEAQALRDGAYPLAQLPFLTEVTGL
jgi:hypothetical protein